MADVLREFLIAVGFTTDRTAERQQADAIKRVETSVTRAEKAMTAQSNVGSASRIIALNREAGVRTKGAAQHIAELKLQSKTITTFAEAEKAATAERKRLAESDAASRRKTSTVFIASMAAMATAAVAAGVRMAEAVTRVAGNMDQLYHASQRTRASAGNLKAFGYAASQLGGSVEGAMGSLEALAGKMRASPGYESMLNSLGVSTRENGELRDTVNVVEDLGKAFAGMKHFQALAYANALGIDERTMSALKSGEFAKRAAEYRDMLAQAKLDPKQAAKDSADFMQVFRRMQNGLEIVGMRIESALVKQFGGSVNKFTDWLLNNSDRIASAFAKIGEYLLRFIDHLSNLFKAFDNLDPKTKDFLIKLGALAGALVLLNSGPLGALVAITAALVAFLDEDKLKKLGEMWERFDALAKKLTGQDGLVLAFEALGAVMLLRVLAPLTKITGLMAGLVGLSMPAWLLALLGIAGVGAGAAAANQLPKVLEREGAAGVDPSTGGATDRSVTDGLIEPGQEGGGQRWLREKWGRAKRALGLGGANDGVAANPGAYKEFLDHVAGAEGTAGRPGGGYNTSLSYGAFLPGGKEQELTKKTLDEIDALQTGMLRHPGNSFNSSAIGRYQIVRTTLRDQRRKLGLKGSDLYDEKMQDRIAANLARQRGADPVGLRNEWASLVGPKNARAVEIMRQVDPKASTMPLDRPAPAAPVAVPAPVTSAIPKLENALQNFNDRWNDSMGAAKNAPQPFQGRPLGTWSTSSVSTTNNIRVDSPTSVVVSGVGDAKAVGSEVGKTQSRVHADLLRNLQGAVA